MALLIQNWVFVVMSLLVPLIFVIIGLATVFRPRQLLQFHEAMSKEAGLLREDPQSVAEWYRESRFAGIGIAAFGGFMFWIAARSARHWMKNPLPTMLQPAVQGGRTQWELLLFGILLFVVGFYLLVNARTIVRRIFERAPRLLLISDGTLLFWTIFYRVFGVLAMFGSFLPLTQWALSLR
ncbi:MAG: hypothetical protein HYR58_03015 [Acidobacteria bacterium]|nr:hypothetical protein [Acidobacteriota bacterium]